ncbi:[protein-PII] uridylyltransferase [Paracraurococcus lichenis]|uniref:Bifunctional uridylyltransferase/uridylyl-removing enzyme n=1 Tax=Paracraurococcus lichenis TaxID=3064888 RepID=A0ABT9E2D2_9PROT|nr:[protein-PII] uridylyltransferase [Paracraurococcus sp. LOR1-02]MDO9710331.1 [protein-PII] uridylyltransferase [Paracraurococcus sp. LOR1-02]
MTAPAAFPTRAPGQRHPVLAEVPTVIPDLIAELTGEAGGGPIRREDALDLLRRHLGRIQATVQESFEAHELSGLASARWLAALTDGLMGAIHHYALAMVPAKGAAELAEAPFALVATGGYGRGVLAPFSDIDLLFLTDQPAGPRAQRVVEFVLYFLWDLGLKVGHATRCIRDCIEEAAKDSTVLTALVDSRFLAGEKPVYERFAEAFTASNRQRGLGPFLAAKRAERAGRHARYGDSPYLVEPNIKEGRGGLRDLQTLYWLARYAFGTQRMPDLVGPDSPGGGLLTEHEARAIRRAWDFLWTVRFHLHYVAGRAEERLTFDFQPVVGARMGYTPRGRQDGVERFMKHLFLTVRDVLRLTRVLEPAIERAALGPPATRRQGDAALAEAGLALADGKLVAAPPNRDFSREPVLMLRILKAARDRKLEVHPLAIRALIRNAHHAAAIRGDAEANTLFLDLLSGRDAATWLRLMNETGFLSRFVPDWARIVGLMQFDTYHVYTVDEHTIEAIGVLQQIERGELAEAAPVASELIGQLQSRRALYMATLLHDIAKGRGGDHSELGARIATELGPKIGLTPEETETVSWLVLHHLLISQTAFKRDIEDPKTILDIADLVQSPERLRLLLVLTVCDMRAVGPKVWNGWKATLLREVYWRVAEVLAGGLSVPERDVRVARARDAAAAMLTAWPEKDREHFLALGYPGYWLSFDAETHARHASLIREAEASKAPLTVRTRVLESRAVTEITVYAADHPGLFSRIAGALAVAGASIVDARIHTLTNGMALDTFWVQDAMGGAFDAPHRLARLSVLIEQALSGRLRLKDEIRKVRREPARLRAVTVPPRVVFDNHASNSHTVIEVNGRDRPGLLHDVTAAISDQGLQIASAHITTYGVRAVDVFYVKDVFGLKVENERKLASLRTAMEAALAPPGEGGGSVPSASRAAAERA